MEPDTISVRLLGGFSVRFGDHVLQSLPPQAVSLLSYLIVHRDRPQTRDLLAGRFWSELPEDRARKRLSNSLWQIKHACAESGMPDLLITTPGSIQVTGQYPVSVDAEDFENQLTDFERELRSRQVRGVLADRLANLVSGYPGDFLSGHYHDWIEPERNRIRDRYQGALVELIQLYKSRSQYDVALRFAGTLVEQEPLREDLHREVMRLHALLGQPLAAERQFETCCTMLDAELGLEPSAETVELIERIRSDAPSPIVRAPSAASGSGALVGRSQELSVLLGRADELLGGTGGVVLVEGDPGIGKTRLIEEFVEAADWRGVRILRAGHTDLSAMKPYETLREALSVTVTGLRGEHLAEVIEPVWLQQAAEVLPELTRLVDGFEPSRPLRPEEEPTRMSEALARVILAQGGLGPTLIVLEDIHWCDDDSMQVLSQLGSRLARSGVLLCLTYRRFEAEQSDSVWSGISRLEALPSGSRLVVGPLSNAEVRELVQAHLGPGGLPGPTVSQLVGQTEGNPLYVLESVRNPDGLLSDAGERGDGSLGVLDLPPSVARSLEARISALDPDALSVLQGLAALAEPSSATLVAQVASVDRRVALETLTRMADRGFVEDDVSGVCRFSHDQTRRAVYELIPSDRRTSLHDQIYKALDEDKEEQAERLAYHARLARRMADARSWHLVAAREALAVNGFRTAADHFGKADEAAQDMGIDLADRAIDLLACEAAFDVLGRRSEQTMLLKSLREIDLPLAVELELAEREVWLLLNTDEFEEGARLAMQYVERAKDANESYVGLLTAVGVASYRAGDFGRAVESSRQALEAATDTMSRIPAEITLGKALVDRLDFDAGEEYLARAVANAELCGDYRGKVEALSYQAVAQSLQGRFADADQLFTTSLEQSRSIGYRWGEGVNLVNLATLHTRRGHGGLAIDFFNAASDVFGSLDHGRGEAFVKLNSAELSHSLLGDDVAAAELANSAAVYFRSVGDHAHEALAMCVHSSVDARNGNRRLARRRLTEVLRRAEEQKNPIGEVEPRRVVAQLEIDGKDWRAASVQLDHILRLGKDYALEPELPNVLASRALAAVSLDDWAKAEEMTERALDLNRVGVKVAHVNAWLCARVLSALGDDARATEQFSLAHELLEASLQGLPADLVAQSWSVVPEHVGIVEDYQRRVSVTKAMQIPASDAPMGRPLNPDEFVDVTWTVSNPTDWEVVSPAERRQKRLCRLAAEAEAQNGSARIRDFANALDVSERTIKRDIAELRSRGTTVRTRKSS